MTRARKPVQEKSGAGPRRLFVCSKDPGCPVNLAFTTQLHNYVARNGWEMTPADSADCIVVASCSAMPEYRHAVAEAVQHFVTQYPSKQIFVTCCFVDADRIEAPNLAYIPRAEGDEFDKWFNPAVPLRETSSTATVEDEDAVRAMGRDRAVFNRPYHVLVETGCLSRCSYCLEHEMLPRIQSVPLAEVVARCHEGRRKGYTNFTIAGTDVCSYGHDLGCDVTALFDALFTEVFTSDRKLGVGFKSLEPSRLIKHFARLKGYFETRRIDWIDLPVASGSDAVLRAMNRHYRIADVMALVAELRRVAPKMRIGTDLVICFPTETREDFEASMRLVDEFDHLNVLPFGRHETTAANEMPDQFSAEERARRCEVVSEINSRAVKVCRPEIRTRHEVQLAACPGGPELFTLEPLRVGRPTKIG